MSGADERAVAKVAEKMATAFAKDYRWVCTACGHVGDQAQKKKRNEERTATCEKCGGPTTLKRGTVSGKPRRPHSLKKFEHRDEVEREGPAVFLEPLPESVELSDRFVEELERGARPTLTLPKTGGLAPLQAGHVYEVGAVDVYVTNVRDTGAELTVEYASQRAEQTVRQDAPLVNPAANPEQKPTHQRGWVDERAGEEHAASPEAERLTAAEHARLMRPKLEEKLARVTRQEEQADALVKVLERDYSQNITRTGREQVTRLTRIREAAEEDIRNLGRHRREKS